MNNNKIPALFKNNTKVEVLYQMCLFNLLFVMAGDEKCSNVLQYD